jgi:hypothetical protein
MRAASRMPCSMAGCRPDCRNVVRTMSGHDPQVLATTDTRQSRGSSWPWPWLVALVSLAVFAIANLLYPSGDADVGFTVIFGAIIGAFVFVGALLTTRVRANPIGRLMLGSGALLATTVAVGTLSILGAERGGVSPALLALGAILNELGFLVAIVGIMVGIPLIFPDGNLLSRRWRWVVVAIVLGIVAGVVSQLIGPGPLGTAAVPNPFAVPALFPLAAILDTLASVSTVAYLFGVAAVVIRYRRASDVERHQLKWLIAVAVVAAIALPIAFLAPEGPLAAVALGVGLLATFALPVAIAVAILRYRLYDIDRIISRSIAWALISTLLVAAFALLVVGLQNVLAGITEGDTLAVAGSTLAAVALFQPLRRAVQHAVDCRFDRAAYDARRTAEDFAERLREQVDLDALAADLERTVSGAMRPSAARVWLPPRSEHAP